MKRVLPLSLLIWVAFLSSAFGQQQSREWFITGNGNLYIPLNNPYKGVYPVLWFDEETDPKLLIGGLGLGVSLYQPFREKLSLKGQANLSKHTYWDERTYLTNARGQLTEDYLAGSSDYSLGITATVHYFLLKRLSFGIGAGGQILLASLSRLPEPEDRSLPKRELIARNRYYKPFIPVLPVELSLKYEKILFSLRYEHGLINRIKGELSNYQTDKFSLLSFEVGFRIK